MKVIGSMAGVVTVQMRQDELSAITGHSVSDGRMQTDVNWCSFELLGEIEVRKGWDRLKALFDNREQLQKAIRQLRAIADVLEPLELVVLPEPKAAEEEAHP